MRVMLAIVVSCTASLSLCVGPGAAPALAKADQSRSGGQVFVVQATPGVTVDVSVDDKTERRSVGEGAVLGPFRLSAGTHRVGFSGAGDEPILTSIEVRPGSSSDVVLHLPAASDQPPVVNSYRAPTSKIGPGKARVLLAHTATTTPADVKFDGKRVFRNIANGEYAEADVPEGTHRVALVPSDAPRKPLLGPLTVTLRPRTVTMIYAVGSPKDGSMSVIEHTLALSANGAVVPERVHTGSAGLVADVRVEPFSSAPSSWLARVYALLAGPGAGSR